MFSFYVRSSTSRHGLERQPHGINRSKRGGHGGQGTRIKGGHKPGVLINHTTTSQFQYSRHARSKYLFRACNSRNNHPKGPDKIRERSTIRHPNILKPTIRGTPIAVIEVVTDAPKESSECLRIADAGLQALFYLHKKLSKTRVRSAEEGRSEVMAFRTNLRRGRFQRRIHVSAASVVCDES